METAKCNKPELRALCFLKLAHWFHKEHGRYPRQVDLGLGATYRALLNGEAKGNQETLLEVFWRRFGLDDEYPRAFRHPLQLVQAVNALRAAGLVQKPGKRRSPYSLTEEGKALAEKMGEDWRTWKQALPDGLPGMETHQAPTLTLTPVQKQLLAWAVEQSDPWSLDEARRVFPYINKRTMNRLVKLNLVWSQDGRYRATDSARAVLEEWA